MNDFQGLYKVRNYHASDRSFILATFLRGLYYGDSWFSLIPKRIFMDNYKFVAEKLINGRNTVISVACLPDDPDVILGYSILSSDYRTTHWVYVKSAWRNKGIGKSLIPKSPAYASHLSKLGKELMNEKLKTTEFNPFSI